MVADERRNKILELLNLNGSVRVTELSRLFDISEVTIRTDLADMEYKGLLTRVHGGAVSSYKPYYSMSLNQRLSTNQSQKEVIAKKIASMIENNDTIMLNSGTTTLMVFRALPQDFNLSIVTNSISIALEGTANPNFNIILLGGLINSKYQFTFGDDAIRQLKSYHADKLILSVDGIDAEHGFSTYYDKEAEIDRIMLQQSSVNIVAADHSKFDRRAFTKISDLSVADYIVTDTEVPEKIKSKLSKHSIKIV
ncbi:MAG: DeoR/GlpR family DNA-binding transcription regulator [Clostridia bacterium]|nr:DeoR/GlpR family DNA-binding transcription regulator [Clostridia bacterium]